LNYNIYDVISKAATVVSLQIGTFSTTFAPIKDPQKALKILLDIIGLSFALVASPVWNIGLLP